MTFTSGRCTQVMSGLGGLVSVSWRITITDCAGDELANLMGAGIFALILMICCPILLLCGCVYMCCIRKPQQTNVRLSSIACFFLERPPPPPPLCMGDLPVLTACVCAPTADGFDPDGDGGG
jgi:hypothetical protein